MPKALLISASPCSVYLLNYFLHSSWDEDSAEHCRSMGRVSDTNASVHLRRLLAIAFGKTQEPLRKLQSSGVPATIENNGKCHKVLYSLRPPPSHTPPNSPGLCPGRVRSRENELAMNCQSKSEVEIEQERVTTIEQIKSIA